MSNVLKQFKWVEQKECEWNEIELKSVVQINFTKKRNLTAMMSTNWFEKEERNDIDKNKTNDCALSLLIWASISVRERV